MKDYPSIPRSTGQMFRAFRAHVFDKLDGSCIRAEWSRKRGWFKFGSRSRLLDTSDPILGPAVPLFQGSLAEPLTKLATDQRWQHLIVFAEYWGQKSFAGSHEPGDLKHLTLFDICPDKRGIAGPVTFLKLCGHLPIPRYLGEVNWTREFVERVRQHITFTFDTSSDLVSRTCEAPFYSDGCPMVGFEGVVGKAGEGHKLVMAKAKTQAWIDKVYQRYGPEAGKRIVES